MLILTLSLILLIIMRNSIVLKFEVYLCSYLLKVHLDSPSIATLHTCFELRRRGQQCRHDELFGNIYLRYVLYHVYLLVTYVIDECIGNIQPLRNAWRGERGLLIFF